jgi:hypothetical protein
MLPRRDDYFKDGKDWPAHCRELAEQIPKEKRQEFLNYLKEGMNIGNASKKADLNFDQAHGVINMQFKSISYVSFEAV